MSRRPLRISCFLPSYNEAENVERVVAEAVSALERLAEEFEVIVVDDGSSDGTGEIAGRLTEADPRVRLVRHEKNRGYGGAVITGLRAARLDYVFFTDGDGQFRVADLDRLLPALADADCVVGYRLDRCDNAVRRFNGWAWTQLVNALFGLRFRDIDCAFKLLSRPIVDRIELTSEGAMISTELLARLRAEGARIAEIGVPHHPRTAGSPTGGSPFVILKAFRELWALRRRIEARPASARG